MSINSRSDLAIFALTTALVTPCFAQSSTAPAAESLALEEVVITGSRLATGFATPTPVTMVAAEDLTAAVPNNMGESLAQLPSLAGSVQNTTSGQGSGISQTNGQNLLNLRQLGSNRTLVLLDGQRMGVTNVVGSVDINIIPQNLVRRVDVVTGGASASYGSDAVAGAVNFILDTTFEGFKVDVNAGITDKSDMENGKVSLAFGTALGERGRLVAAGEFFTINGLTWGEASGRDWHDSPTMSVRNATGATPTWLLIPNTRSRFGSLGGTITGVQNSATSTANCTAAACTGLLLQQFQPNGTLTPFNSGSQIFGTNLYVSGGDGVVVNQSFTPNADRYSLFLHGELDLSDNVTLWAQGGYNVSETQVDAQVLQLQSASGQGNQWRIFEDNAYLPAGVASALGAVTGTQSFYLTKYARDMGFNEVVGNVKVTRFATGVKGDINDRWSYDVILGYQNSHQDLDIRTGVFRNLYAAVDAVRHPTTGQIVCRSQWYDVNNNFVPGGTGMDPGCVPANVFGNGNVSQAATDYIMQWNTADVDLKQSTFDVNLRGDFGDDITLGAGPISFATGMNYRRMTAERKVDPLSATYKDGTGLRGFPNQQGGYGGYTYYNPSPLNGRVSVSEGYVEFGLPLLRDLPMFQELATTLAGRVTDYSQSGVENMWKLGLNWTMNDSVRFRSTLSADTRAPTVIELFNTATVSRGSLSLPYSAAPNGITANNVQTISKGNTNLSPERARTYTGGFVFSPGFAPGFQASIDWYLIKLLGGIQAPGQQNIIDGCYFGNQAYCALIQINGQAITTTANATASDFVQTTNPLLNVPADRQVSGIDIEAAYKASLGAGDLTLRLTGNYALKDYNPDNDCAPGSLGDTNDYVGTVGACGVSPKIKARISAKYDIGKFGIYVQERFIDNVTRNPNFASGVDISSNDIPAIWYTDLTLSYAVGSWRGGEGEVYFNITNALDKDPPPTNSDAGRSWIDPTIEELYDVLGRRYVLGARYKW